jgi:hypothetical protein
MSGESGKVPRVQIMVTRIAGDGRLLHRLADTATRGDPARWESLLSRAALADPPPYQPAPGVPVCLINTGDQPVVVTQNRLTGPLDELVSAVLAEGDPVTRQAPPRAHGPEPGNGAQTRAGSQASSPSPAAG